MDLDDRKKILEIDYPKFVVTEQTRKDVLDHPQRCAGSDIRIRMGKFYTYEEYEKYVEEVLSRPLPGEEKQPKKILSIFKRKKK